jgi:hypothetical protein
MAEDFDDHREIRMDAGKVANSQRPLLTDIVAERYPPARASLVDLLRYDGHQALEAESLEAALCHMTNTVGPILLRTDADK